MRSGVWIIREWELTARKNGCVCGVLCMKMRCVMEWGCKGFYRRNEGVYGCLFKHACGWNVVEKQLGKLVESWKACEGHGKASLVLKWVLFCMPRDV